MNDNETAGPNEAAKIMFDYLTEHQVLDLDEEKWLGVALLSFFNGQPCPENNLPVLSDQLVGG